MFKLQWITLLLLAGLAGCTSNFVPAEVGTDGEYIGWHCEGDVSSRDHWRCEKKTMKEGVLVSSPAVAVKEGESVIEELATDEPVTEAPVKEAPAPAVVSEPVSESSSQPALPDSGFTVQLGAYTSRQIAESVANSFKIDGPLKTVDIMTNGQRFSVVILGQYSTKEQAQQAAEQLNETLDGKQINYWVRSMRSLLDAVVK
ncbi:SPOR domain-containing protein [Porticoccaceae bacterium]|nr:SPOR domain-containing protein [Porticoccaceae bacterium]